ncbi:multidrug effflux MFS transporter [Leisingera sp. ANG-M1]|uniref:multidrug effflux MFS transporter n=1 Tax=Leisingera sp. ANG-M1 TaxID=1577895 RepID=UPI0009E60A77|nr:multidrug effflux MFS transporter [Leisingera sp. ANG-M1]
MSQPQAQTSAHGMAKAEFIALIAMMFATIALSIDAMLPALPEIGQSLSPDNINRAQLVLTSFVLGMGLGTFFTGPLSDAFGRKPVVAAGCVLYVLSAVTAWLSPSLEVLLISRVLMGIGAAGPRIVGVAVVRDLYSGREMARLMSIAMMIFMIVPAIAPLMGAGIIAISSWRVIFLSFALFATVIVLWTSFRLPETLAVEDRRPLRTPLMMAAVKEMMAHPTVRLSIFVQTLCLGMLFTMLTMVQPVYDIIFGRAESFPFWFGLVALISGTASLLNAAIVVRIGMRRIVTVSLAAQIVITGGMLLVSGGSLPDPWMFGLFVGWQASVFFMVGTTVGNLNAMAMEPMGHIAGMAASVIGAISTVLAAAIAAPVGLLFDGSLVPLAAGLLIMACIAFLLMLQMAKAEARLPAE